MEHAIFSDNKDMAVEWFEKFDKEAIKKAIVKHLANDPTDTLEHCKEYSKKDIKKYYGMEIINFYKCNKKGEPCLIILKGNKEYLKKLTI